MTKEIRLTQGKVAIVSDSDYDILAKWKWHAALNHHGCGKYYVVRSDGMLMHRLVVFMHGYNPVGFDVDHINLDTLDNRIENLRVCTHSENMRNRNGNGGASEFRGVNWNSQKQCWQVKLDKHIGFYESQVIAAVFANDFIRERDGAFARPNIIPEHIEVLARRIPPKSKFHRTKAEIEAQRAHAAMVDAAYTDWLAETPPTASANAAANAA